MSSQRKTFICAAVLTLMVGVSGCATTANPREAQRAAMQPTDTPSSAVGPIADPRNAREIQATGFRLAADSAFQRFDETSKNGEPMLMLRRASKVSTLAIQVAVLRDPKPAQDVIEQSYALEVSKRAFGAVDITRSKLVWPDAEQAVLVQWTENVPTSAGASVPTRYWQLNVQTTGGLILVVVGLAPAAEFDQSMVTDVMRTLRIKG